MLYMLVIALALALPEHSFAESRLLRHPTDSNGTVAFSYLGDIWTVKEDGSEPYRVTDHSARDVYPRFSPDGRWIAFSSNRNGNYDVYIVSVRGGRPRQLTFHGADDNVVGWHPDGRSIIFTSNRGKGMYPANPTMPTLFEVSSDGGPERSIATDVGTWASYAPDGRTLAITRRGVQWMRQHSRGSNASDLWTVNVATRAFTKLGDDEYRGNYLWPMYGPNGQIYFVADRLPNERSVRPGSPEVLKSTNNIWRIPERGGTPVQVTHHTSGSLFFPSMSHDGRTIVYEENFQLWKLDTATGRSVRIPVDIESDTKTNDRSARVFRSEAPGLDFSLSPSGRRIAIHVQGEIYTVATERGKVQSVTDSAAHDEAPNWSPDGKWIAMISDRTGRPEIWLSDELGQTRRQLSEADCDKSNITWAPDSKSLLWSGSDFALRRIDLESGTTEILSSSTVASIGDAQFSPDSKWVSYTKQDLRRRPHVFIKQIGSTDERQIDGNQLADSRGARWTPDGRTLLFLGQVGSLSESFLATGGVPGVNAFITHLFALSLTASNSGSRSRGIDTEADAQALATRKPAPVAEPGPPKVAIEWEGIDRRIRRLSCPNTGANGVFPSPDGRTYVVMQGGQLFTMADDGSRITRIGQGLYLNLQWARDSRTLFFLRPAGGTPAPGTPSPAPNLPVSDPNAMSIFSIPIPPPPQGDVGLSGTCDAPATPPAATPRRVEFAVTMEVDHARERDQLFEEVWQILRYQYYDQTMNGVNWSQMRERYRPLLADIQDSDELRTVIMQMAGELNSSHIRVAVPESSTQDAMRTWHPGFEIVADGSYYRVGRMFRRGPASYDNIKLEQGDYLLAVNGTELHAADNYWRLLTASASRPLEFTVNTEPRHEGSWVVTIEPIGQTEQTTLEYQHWVDEKKALVERLSNGTVGYLHIRAMDGPSLLTFQRDLQENAGKKALIIDVRFNPGGNIEQPLLSALNDAVYGSVRPRNSIDTPRAGLRFFGPMVVLQNEFSNSDSELFAQGFRSLGLGKLVGVTTPGSLIWTYNMQLSDGTELRVPRDAVFDANGRNLENLGVQPDVFVENTPEDFVAGRDRQLEKALQVVTSSAGSSEARRGESRR